MPESPSTQPPGPGIRVRVAHVDVLSAARALTSTARTPRWIVPRGAVQEIEGPVPNVCVLTDLSPAGPTRHAKRGIKSQESFIRERTTLIASINEDMIPPPLQGGIFSSEVLVFADTDHGASLLPDNERYYIDVISSRLGNFQGSVQNRGDDACACKDDLYCRQHRDEILSKMAAVVKEAERRGIQQLVIGAWGGDRAGHPHFELAKLWRRTLFGTLRNPRTWSNLIEIVFAMTSRPRLNDYDRAFENLADRAPLVDKSVRDTSRRKSPPRSLVKRRATEKTAERIADLERRLADRSEVCDRSRMVGKLADLKRRMCLVGRPDEETPENSDEAMDSGRDEDDTDDDYTGARDGASEDEDSSEAIAAAVQSLGMTWSDAGMDQDEADDNNSSSSPCSREAEPIFNFNFHRQPQAQPSEKRNSSSSNADSYIHADANDDEDDDDNDDMSSAPSSPDDARPPSSSRSQRESWDWVTLSEKRKKLIESDGWYEGSMEELVHIMGKSGTLRRAEEAVSPPLTKRTRSPEVKLSKTWSAS